MDRTTATSIELARLKKRVEHAYRQAFDPADVLPDLHKLERKAPQGSDTWAFAVRSLAEILSDRDPWRASLHARKLLAARPTDEHAWASLGFAQTLLGHYRYAVRAYRAALDMAPRNPSYAHNLGHLLDVALNNAPAALPFLKLSVDLAPEVIEFRMSYAHGLASAGKRNLARKIMKTLEQEDLDAAWPELESLRRWIESEDRTETDAPSTRILPHAPPSTPDEVRTADLESLLHRGLARLPFEARQQTRAIQLMQDAMRMNPPRTGSDVDMRAYAAAVAFGIAYVNQSVLTVSDVAGSFRANRSAASGYFDAIRARLLLKPGDRRYR